MGGRDWQGLFFLDCLRSQFPTEQERVAFPKDETKQTGPRQDAASLSGPSAGGLRSAYRTAGRLTPFWPCASRTPKTGQNSRAPAIPICL